MSTSETPSVRYYIPAPRQNTGETKAKSSPHQGTRAPLQWQTFTAMTARLARLVSSYRATASCVALTTMTIVSDAYAGGPGIPALPAIALTLPILALELHRAHRSQPKPPAPRFISSWAVAAVGGGYYGVAADMTRKPIYGPKRTDRHAALTDLHNLLEELER